MRASKADDGEKPLQPPEPGNQISRNVLEETQQRELGSRTGLPRSAPSPPPRVWGPSAAPTLVWLWLPAPSSVQQGWAALTPDQ